MSSVTRRKFAVTTAATALTAAANTGDARPAILGGAPVRKDKFPAWPVMDQGEEKALLAVLRSGRWNRGRAVERFEADYAKLTGTQHCLAAANGTSALLLILNAMGIGAGDEVIVPPYTFVATINVVLNVGALPVFVDTDPETFQIDARKIEAAITPRTRAIMPVHLGGAAADLDAILALGRRRNIPVIEDACQAHLGEWRGKKVGSLGTAGGFSFQASKNLNSGEGGALITNDSELVERAYTFHNNGRGRRQAHTDFSYTSGGLNLRLTDFQAALLLAQMERLEQQSRQREQNAAYLTKMLSEIPGIRPARMYEGCTRNAYHLYMLRYDAGQFAGLPRAKFLKAMAAEGVPASGGYAPLNKEPYLRTTFATRGYQAVYGSELKTWAERTACPANDRLCTEAVWFTQTMLLGPRTDMEQIAEAVRKVKAAGAEIARA